LGASTVGEALATPIVFWPDWPKTEKRCHKHRLNRSLLQVLQLEQVFEHLHRLVALLSWLGCSKVRDRGMKDLVDDEEQRHLFLGSFSLMP
jgi:hypothetical protein